MLRILLALCCFLPISLQAEKLRVASINLCADQLLLLLAEPTQITSLSFLSSDSQYSDWVDVAQQYPVNFGGAEEIVRQRPDLVLAGQYSNPLVLRLLRQQGIEVLQVARANNLNELFDATLLVGDALGVSQRAMALVAQWQADIQQVIEQASQISVSPSIAIIGPNGFTEGQGTLRNEMLQRLGVRNVAAELGKIGNTELSLEQLLIIQPDMLVIEDTSENPFSLAQRFLQHPALASLSHLQVALPAQMWGCPGPSYVKALQGLQVAKQQWANGFTP